MNFVLCRLIFDNTGGTDFQLITQLVENLIRGINRKVILPLLVYRFIYLSLFISVCVALVDVWLSSLNWSLIKFQKNFNPSSVSPESVIEVKSISKYDLNKWFQMILATFH